MIDHLELVVEPRHPLRETLQGARIASGRQTIYDRLTAPTDAQGPCVYRIVNSWFDRRKGGTITILQHRVTGKAVKIAEPDGWPDYREHMLLNTWMASCEAWSRKAEERALESLSKLVKPHLFDAYVLSGTLVETSDRSGVVYLFRKLRPTIAMRPNAHGNLKAIAALCLHPIAYYRHSFAGAMVPTDDVIAHLLLMRGDEPYFWRKANHHNLWRPESGL